MPVLVIGLEHKVVAGVAEVSVKTTVPALGKTEPAYVSLNVAVNTTF